jgi:competence protein ComGC
MKLKFSRESVKALTLIEVIVIVAVIAVLWVLFMPAVSNRPVSAPKITCVNNLKNVGLSFRLFQTDYGGKFPMQLSTNQGGTSEFVEGGNAFRHFQVMSNELSTPKVLVCPADKRKVATNFVSFRNEHLSYFVGLDATTNDVQMLLAGDRNVTNTTPPVGSILYLTTNQTSVRGAGWDKEMHVSSGNVVLADGSVQPSTTSRLRDQLRVSTVVTQRLALP